MIFRHTALVGLILSLMATAAHADGFRCPRTDRLINEGDTSGEVSSKCGASTSQQRVGGRRQQFDEQWIYDFGSNFLTRILWFKRGRLVRVDVGEYGQAASR